MNLRRKKKKSKPFAFRRNKKRRKGIKVQKTESISTETGKPSDFLLSSLYTVYTAEAVIKFFSAATPLQL